MKLSKFSKKKSKEKLSKENVSATGTPSKNSGSNPSTPNAAKKPSKFQNLKGKCTPMMAIVIFLVMALVGVITTLLVLQLKNHSDTWNIINQSKKDADAAKAASAAKEVKTCRTPECIQLAYQLHNFGNPKIDPCVDFFKASCSRYVEHSYTDVDRGSAKVYIVTKLIDSFLRSDVPTSSESEINMRKLYKKCESLKNDGSLRQAYYAEILSNIRNIGWWPLLDSMPGPPPSPAPPTSVSTMLTNMARLKVSDFGLFHLENLGKLFLMPSFFYEHLKSHIFNMTNGQIPMATIEQEIDGISIFFGKLMRLFGNKLLKVKYTDMPSRRMFDMDRVLEILIGSKKKFDAVVEKVVVTKSDLYFGATENLDTVLETTSDRVIANFLIFKYISTLVEDLDKMRNCTSFVITKLPQASLRYFSRNFFDRANMVPATELVGELRTSYKEMFEKSTWLSESTKQNAIRKVEKMKFLLGVPDDEGWEPFVEQSHQALTISNSDSLLATTINVNHFFFQSTLLSFVNNAKINPGYKVLTGNAQYMPPINELTIMVPFMMPPQFDDSYPKHAQFSSTGVVLGHEIGHGFDRNGAKLDENGDQNDWWQQEEVMEYMNRTECLVRQYSDYDDPDYGKNLDGTRTIGEMIADKLGIEASWRAYKRTDPSAEPRIIGFEDDSLDKVYFKLYAMTWCSGPNRLSLQKQLKRPHPTPSFRVNGLLQGFKPFADAFNCPLGSPMNPTDKCEIL